MKHTIFIAALILLVALSGCKSYITLSPQPDYNKIMVSGQAEFKTMPDLAVFEVMVESEAETAAEASGLNAEAINSIKSALIEAGIKAVDIETLSYSVYPWRRYNPKTGEESLEGYKAFHTLKVQTKDIDNIGRYLDAGVAAGATNIQSIRFEFSKQKQKEVNEEALKLAVVNAREKAKILADVSGVSLGKVMSVSESNFAAPSYYPRLAVAEGMAKSYAETDISPQQISNSATIQVVFLIE